MSSRAQILSFLKTLGENIATVFLIISALALSSTFAPFWGHFMTFWLNNKEPTCGTYG